MHRTVKMNNSFRQLRLNGGGGQAISPLRHQYFPPMNEHPLHSTATEHDIACPRSASASAPSLPPSHTFSSSGANCERNACVPGGAGGACRRKVTRPLHATHFGDFLHAVSTLNFQGGKHGNTAFGGQELVKMGGSRRGKAGSYQRF